MRTLRALPSPASTDDADGLARGRPQAFTRRELEALWSPRKVRTAIERGAIVRLLPNVYVAAEHSESFEARADAALTWAGADAMLIGASALYVWTLLDEPPETIDIATVERRHLSPPPWLRVQCPTYDIASRHVNGHSVAPVATAIAQGYGDLSPGQQSDAVFGAVARGLVTTRELRAVLVSMPRIRQRRRLTSRVEAAERGAESWLEEVGLQSVFTGRDFDGFVRQHRIRCHDSRYRLDMYDPFSRLAVELDGATWHRSDQQRLRDIRRDADLATIGIQTIRLATTDLVERPQWCRDIVLRARTARMDR
ncbi:endonuclease domain-containing protein [Demequina aestuarii]|uniref:endonuclease domain-containing protein n=1 Tax=Demequina aestuarii TaxID=327095 RepID=UPI00128E1A0A|nr:hypothetical protein [Demequina aestuarii]